MKHEHTEEGRIAKDADGKDIVLHEAEDGFGKCALDIEDQMLSDIMDVLAE